MIEMAGLALSPAGIQPGWLLVGALIALGIFGVRRNRRGQRTNS